MNVTINQKEQSKIAVIRNLETLIENAQDAMDLMATTTYYYDCYKIIILKESISEDFFDLKTGLAGEIMQKFTNYNMKVAVVGDYGVYESNSLKDFIYECNKGRQLLFLPTMEAAIDKLHQL